MFFSTNIVEILLKLWTDASSGSGAVKAFLQGSSSPSPSPSWHHHHHHHHHYCSLYLRNDQKIWITTKIHIFTKGFKHIECGRFLRDHAGFHEHNEPRVVLYKLWHDIINSHKVTKHACTFSCCHLSHNTPHIPSRYNNEQTTKQTKAINNSYIYKYLM